MAQTSYRDFVMAVDRVERRLRQVTAALEEAGIRYAVIGGNAVAAWISRVDPAATRTTKDVDLLVDRASLDRVTAVMQQLGFRREDLRRLVLFIDPEEPSRQSGVHLVWANEKVRPSYVCPTPTLDEAVRDPAGFMVVDLAALVRMKLTSNRDIDRVHVRDLLKVGSIAAAIESALPAALRQRLAEIRESTEDD